VQIWKLALPHSTTRPNRVATAPTGHTLKAVPVLPAGSYGNRRKGWRYFVNCVAFSRDTKFIAAGGMYHQEKLNRTYPDDNWYDYDGDLSIWDRQTGKLRFSVHGQGDEVIDLAFSPSGIAIVTATSGEAKLWDTRSGQLLWRLPLSEVNCGELCGVAWKPDGDQIVTATIQYKESDDEAGVIALWDVATKRLLWSARYGNRSGAVNFSPDGRFIVSSCGWGLWRDEGVESVIWDATNGRKLRVLPGQEKIVFSADKKTALAYNAYEVRVFETSAILQGLQ
jgi:WD40 repeat protein